MCIGTERAVVSLLLRYGEDAGEGLLPTKPCLGLRDLSQECCACFPAWLVCAQRGCAIAVSILRGAELVAGGNGRWWKNLDTYFPVSLRLSVFVCFPVCIRLPLVVCVRMRVCAWVFVLFRHAHAVKD